MIRNFHGRADGLEKMTEQYSEQRHAEVATYKSLTTLAFPSQEFKRN